MLPPCTWLCTHRHLYNHQAFSSDVQRVTFNAYNGGQLTTAGAGHIRFWNMASTFTGLKLQGQIGG